MFGTAPTRPRDAPKLFPCSKQPRKVHKMFYTIAVVLIILWLLGLVTSYTMGGLIHILLVVALIVILVNFITGRKTL